MENSLYLEEQVTEVPEQLGTRVEAADLCGEHQISAATLRSWKANFGSMAVIVPAAAENPWNAKRPVEAWGPPDLGVHPQIHALDCATICPSWI